MSRGGKRLRERAQYAAARLVSSLPASVKIALSGEPPVILDGQQLDPQLQLLRSIRRRRGAPGLIEPSIAAGRARYQRDARVFRGPVTAVGSVRDLEVPGGRGPLRARHYTPPDCRPAAALTLYLHGGGFVIGDLDTHDEPCRLLCRHAGVQVLSVEYRLAPEHPFPAAVDDATAAFQWALSHAAALGADRQRVTIGGDSAGANLAAAVCTIAEDDWRPSAQLLIYPPTDARTPRPSHQRFAESFVLTLAEREAFLRHYTQGQPVAGDPRLSVLGAAELSRIPPSVIALAGFDILRDEGAAYAEALDACGVPVHVLRFPSLEHGFIHLTGVCAAAREAVTAVAWHWGALVNQTAT